MSLAPLINTDSLNQWLAGQLGALAVTHRVHIQTHTARMQRDALSQNHSWLAVKRLFAVIGCG